MRVFYFISMKNKDQFYILDLVAVKVFYKWSINNKVLWKMRKRMWSFYVDVY